MKNLICLLCFLVSVSLQAQILDPSFPQPNGEVQALLLDGNTLYVGGTFTLIGNVWRNNAAAIDLTTKTVTDWNPNPNNTVADMEILNGTVYMCGKFTTIKGQDRNAIGAVSATDATLHPFTPKIKFPGIPNMQTGTVSSLSIRNNILYIGGYFISIDNLPRPNIASFNLNDHSLTNLVVSPNIPVEIVEATDDQLYFGGPFGSVNGTNRSGYASVSLPNGVLTDWNPSADAPGNPQHQILPDGDKVYICGTFFNPHGVPRPYLARTTADGTPDNWNPGIPNNSFSSQVKAITTFQGKLAVAGKFEQAGGKTLQNFALLDKATGLAEDFNPSPLGIVQVMAANDSLLILGGFISSAAGQNVSNLAVFTTGTSVSTYAAKEAGTLQVNPNPAHEYVLVELPDAEVQRLTLYNTNGQIARTLVTYLDHQARIELQHLPAGVYIMELFTKENGRYFARIVVPYQD